MGEPLSISSNVRWKYSAGTGYIFQDIFEWAGHTRTINMEKAEKVLGGLSVEYSDVADIEKHLNAALAHLNETKWPTLDTDFHDLGDRSNLEYLVRIVHDAIERGAPKEI